MRTQLAWIALAKGKGEEAIIVQKPLQTGEGAEGLVCWGWSVGGQGDTFRYGSVPLTYADVR